MLTITPALPHQLSTVHDIVHATIRAIYPHYYPPGAVEFFISYHSMEKITTDIQTGRVWLLAEDDVFVGTAAANGPEVARLFVLPEHQGKGYGSTLMNFCENIVFSTHEYVKLHASFPAYAIYEKRGYRPTVYHKVPCDNGDYLCIHEMKLDKPHRTVGEIPCMSNKNPLIIRPIIPSELPLLEAFLYEAIFIPPGIAPPPRDIIYKPEVFIYIKDFGSKPDDFCLVAQLHQTLIGAAWTRIIPAFGHIDDETPELAISVLPEHRGKGIGSAIMHTLLNELKARGYRRTSLAAQQKNAAVRFYQRLGYEIVNESDEEYIMAKKL